MLPEFIFHHLGVVTHSIAATAAHYVRAGYRQSPVVCDPVQQVNISFLTRADAPMIELIEPLDEKSSVQKVLKKSGVTPYHFCYQVPDIDQACEQLQALGYILLFRPVEAEAFDQKCVSYLYHPEVGFIELLQA